MSVHGAPLDHRLYVLLAVLTHAFIGFTLGTVWARGTPAAGAVGGVLPDVDLLFAPEWRFPFVHRGVTHTLFCCALVVGVALAVSPLRRAAPGIALGYLSHLVVDTLTASGIAWMYPVSTTSYAFDVRFHALEHQPVLWLVLLGTLAVDRWRRTAGRSGNPPNT